MPLELPTAKMMRILEHNVRLPLVAQKAPPQIHTIGWASVTVLWASKISQLKYIKYAIAVYFKS